jgi:hypothetical protein
MERKVKVTEDKEKADRKNYRCLLFTQQRTSKEPATRPDERITAEKERGERSNQSTKTKNSDSEGEKKIKVKQRKREQKIMCEK